MLSTEGDVLLGRPQAPVWERLVRVRGAGAAVLGAGAVLAAAGIAASLEADAPTGVRLRYAVLNALIIVVPFVVGLYASQRAAHRRFGFLLIAAGVLWSTAALAQANSSVAYSVGRIGGWLVGLLLVWLVLSYPTGELRSRIDRRLVAVGVALVGLLYLPTALLIEAYPTQTPWSSCRIDCPANAFMVADAQPQFVEAVIYPLRETILIAVFVAAIARVAQRMRRATLPQRQMLAPVLVAASLQLLLWIVFLIARRTHPGAAVVDTLGWLVGLCVPLVALAFLVGLVRWRLYAARALQRLAIATKRQLTPAELRDSLADSLADPSLALLLRRDGRWVDPAGAVAAPPKARPGQIRTDLRSRDDLVGAAVHDSALADDREFLAAVEACTVAAIDNARLQTSVDAVRREIEGSRSRLLAEADDERRRLERDLHDGAQQRLVVLAIKLERERERLADRHGSGSHALAGLAAEVDDILDEIRSLGRGIHPSLLADRGIAAALQAAAARSPLPAHVQAGDAGRFHPEIEVAVYFSCLEALQNAGKHARTATGIWITLSTGDALTFEVRDDGAGFDQRTMPPGVGLAGMRDRLAALGGTLVVRSAPKCGTRITGTIPLHASAHG